MPKRHINDDAIKNALWSYLTQMSDGFVAEGSPDMAAIVILARPTGDGEFKVFGAGTIDGGNMDGPTQRKILAALHDNTGSIHLPSLSGLV